MPERGMKDRESVQGKVSDSESEGGGRGPPSSPGIKIPASQPWLSSQGQHSPPPGVLEEGKRNSQELAQTETPHPQRALEPGPESENWAPSGICVCVCGGGCKNQPRSLQPPSQARSPPSIYSIKVVMGAPQQPGTHKRPAGEVTDLPDSFANPSSPQLKLVLERGHLPLQPTLLLESGECVL